MRRLLIVDDEAIITDGLAEIFGRLGLPGLEICKAYSGGEALDWLNSTRIDIVLSDIRMPELNGLELLEVIRSGWPRCRVIFLTGYNDFDSVYQAIQVWGVRYLLKTEGYDKVISEVKEALRELDEGHRTEVLLQQAREQRNTLETLAQGEYFRHLLLGTGIGTAESLQEDFRKLNVPLDPAMPVMLVLGNLVHSGSDTSYSGRREAALAVKLLGDTYFHEKTRCVGIIDRYGDLFWMIQPYADKQEAGDSFEGVVRFLEGTLDLISGACLDSLGIETTFTICSTPFNWEALPGAYDRLRQMQHLRAGDGSSMVVTIQSESVDMTRQTREGLRAEKLEPLAGLLEAGRRDAFVETLGDLSDEVLGDPSVDAIQVMELYYTIAMMLLSYVNRRKLSDQISAIELMRFEGHASWQDAFAFLSRTADHLFMLRRTSEYSRAKTVIQGICSYVEDHIDEDLSVVRLASRFHFNPAYLSRLFKQGSGQNLSDYIEEARIRNAKRLLASGELRVHEVGARVGYESPHSFTRFFKKATGMTPQEFRESSREAAQ
ncbi:helix-turn-helix domain-containing protein [Paenibacillus nanensis]|uniref:Helix-turn-helix domain-containing protein n=1 Tax=Paenibacillus nanensis TaxID=393251 RepID=A0A3A1VFT8_9BACL|nr:helix-turn-helix domain-containing protein [Paenibacillus nanensis]RIX59201.1 helix-turn-helix domain-containing protein [Paenibacillus nanensis]